MKWVALVLLALASQRFYPWPILPHSWEIGIGVTEWGVWVALVCLIWAIAGRRSKPNVVLCCLALISCIMPALQARGVSWPQLFMVAPLPVPAQTVRYAGDMEMDLYPPAGKPIGTILVVHGGSWRQGSRKEFTQLNVPLVQRGYLVACIDYRLAPKNKYPAACEDLDAAWDYLVEQGSDAHKMIWLGRSAGAQLALQQAYLRRPSQAVIAFYPPTDMQWSYDHPSNPQVLDSCAAIADFMGAASYAEASPLQHVSAASPPTLLLHGGSDDLVYLAQSQRLADRLEAVKVRHQLLTLPWANHGFDINLNGPSGQMSTRAVLDFLNELH